MYRDEILDLYKNPRNEGTLNTDYHAEGENPSCGDHTDVYLEVENNKVKEIKHETDGCAISTAAISIVSDELVGVELGEIEDLDKDWIIDKLGIEISPMRIKCALLGLKTVQDAI